MERLKHFENIDFNNWDKEEFDNSIKEGDIVVLFEHYTVKTAEKKDVGGYLRGVINGRYKVSRFLRGKETVEEVAYKKDGTKVIRFSHQWPYHEAKYWKKYK